MQLACTLLMQIQATMLVTYSTTGIDRYREARFLQWKFDRNREATGIEGTAVERLYCILFMEPRELQKPLLICTTVCRWRCAGAESAAVEDVNRLCSWSACCIYRRVTGSVWIAADQVSATSCSNSCRCAYLEMSILCISVPMQWGNKEIS